MYMYGGRGELLNNYPCMMSDDDSREDDAEEKVDVKGCEVSNL